MTLPRGYAALSAAVDFVVPRPAAVATRFFRSYPRFSAFRRFSLSAAYRLSLYKLTIPYAVLAAVFLLATLVAAFYFCFKAAIVPGSDDSNESHPDHRDRTAKFFLIFTSFLHFCIVLCASFAIANVFVIRYSAHDVRLAIQGVQRTIEYMLQIPVESLEQFANLAERVDVSSFSADEAVGLVLNLFRSNKRNFRDALRSVQVLFTNMGRIDRRITNLSTAFFWFSIAALSSVLIGLILSLTCDLSSSKNRVVRLISFSLLAIPLVAMWSHAAISTMLAVATTDFCLSLQEYHKFIDIQATDTPGKSGRIAHDSMFDRYGLTCPSESPVTEQALRHVTTFFAASESIPGFPQAFDAIFELPHAARWNEAKRWMRSRIRKYKECDEQLMFAGRLAFHVCDNNPLSVVSGLSIVWLCSCGISLLFSIVIALLALGQPPTEFISAREIMYIYGAPKLISILDDSTNMLKTQSNFQPWWKSRDDLGTDGSSVSSDEASRKISSTNCSSDDEIPTSTYHERISTSYVTESGRRVKGDSPREGSGCESLPSDNVINFP